MPRFLQLFYGLCALLFVVMADSAAAAKPRRVLLINSFGREFAPFDAFAENFRTALIRGTAEPVEFFEVYLDSARFVDTSKESPFADYLQVMFKDRSPDLVVPIGGPAVRFAQAYRARLFPGTPMLMTGLDDRHIQTSGLTEQDAVVAVRLDFTMVLDGILQVLPETTNICVVLGDSPAERFWLGEVQREFLPYTNRVRFDWLNELSYSNMLKRCATLPPRSAIFYGLLAVDADGISRTEHQTLADLHQSAKAPLFGLHDTQLGRGIVGGPLIGIEELSRRAAGVAARIFQGEAPANFRPPPQTPGNPQFDWRELRRWNIREARLPTGSEIRLRPPKAWQGHRTEIVLIFSICLIEAALIAALLLNLAARRRAERQLSESRERLTLATDSAGTGLWIMEPDNGEIWVTARTRELFQLDPETRLTTEHILQAIHPEDRAEVKRRMTESFTRGTAFAAEFRVVLPEAGVRWIASHGSIARRARSRRDQLMGVSIDVTDRKRTESELMSYLREVMNLRTALDEHAIVDITDAQGQITFANDKFCVISKYAREEVLGQNHRMINSGHHSGEFFRDLWVTVAGGRVWHGEIKNRAKDGSFFWVETTIVPFLGADGKPQRYVALRADVTERKRAQETAQELSRQLISAQEQERARLARELHDDITQRLARLAIDAAKLGRTSSDASAVEQALLMRQELVRLSEDVHALSYRLHPSLLEDLGLSTALRVECDRFEQRQSIPVSVRLGGVPDHLPPEAALGLFRVLQEALRNVARHASARTVEVSLRSLDGGLQLAIRDDGAGFDHTQERHSRPTLGLASMRERIRLLAGELDIDSTPGHGSTILAWVPLKKKPA